MSTVVRGGAIAQRTRPCVIEIELPGLVVAEEAIRLAVRAEFRSVLEGMSAHRVIHRRIDRMGVGRPKFAANGRALIAVDVKAREAPDILLRYQVGERGGETQSRRIEAAVSGIRIGASDEAVVAVARVDDYSRREQPDVVECALPRFE